MSEKQKFGKKGQVLHSQTREVIYVINFFEREAKEGITIPLNKICDRVMQATGITKSTYHRIKKEGAVVNEGASTSFETPHKKRKKINTKCSLDNFDSCSLRRIVNNFYITNKEIPTIKKINLKLREEGFNFDGSDSTLNRQMKKIGFKWKKTNDNRTVLMERNSIRLARISYLRSVSLYRSQNKPIVYLDETYIHSSHTTPYNWTDDSTQGLKAPISKGKRLIIVHAGWEGGFIDNALLIFQSGTKIGDYHSEMNFENFSKWVKEKLIPNLPQSSVIILDNASYHNKLSANYPSSNSKKQIMIDWLTQKGIAHNSTMTKPELYKLIKLNKPTEKRYHIDEIIRQYGHTTLRLPPYHPELNPIEKIWALIKNWVASKNVTFKMADVRKLVEEKFCSVGREEWKKVCDHVKKHEQDLITKEHLIDDTTEHFIITDNCDSDDSESDGSVISGVCELQSDEDN